VKNSLNDAQTTREMEQLGQTSSIMAGEYCLPGMDARYETAFFELVTGSYYDYASLDGTRPTAMTNST
jgi:hypothetical protein